MKAAGDRVRGLNIEHQFDASKLLHIVPDNYYNYSLELKLIPLYMYKTVRIQYNSLKSSTQLLF